MEHSAAPFLVLSGLTKRFGDFAAVRDVNLEIREGEFLHARRPLPDPERRP